MIVITTQYGQTPLHLSSENGCVDVVNALLFHDADIHVKNEVVNIMIASCLLNNLKLYYK